MKTEQLAWDRQREPVAVAVLTEAPAGGEGAAPGPPQGPPG